MKRYILILTVSSSLFLTANANQLESKNRQHSHIEDEDGQHQLPTLLQSIINAFKQMSKLKDQC